MIGTESGSRVLRRACACPRGWGVAMAEAMALAVGVGERSICGTRARAGARSSDGGRGGGDASGSAVRILAAGASVDGLRRMASAGISTYANVAIVEEHSTATHIVHVAMRCSTATHLLMLPALNTLLGALGLPFTLDDPTDLTPSLLLAIFESLICARLPIPPAVRQSRTRDAKTRAMLVLLGVLECDILRGGVSVATASPDDSALAGAGGVSVDGWADEIGLGEVDPERLADGGREETIFVGELLCWLARRKGLLPRTTSAPRAPHPRALYASHHSYGDEGDSADFSTSLLLHPSPAQKTLSPPNTDPDFSVLSHVTDVPRHPSVHSPEPSLSASATTGTDLSMRARSVSSRTSVSNLHDDPDALEEASHATLEMYDPLQLMRDAADDDDRPPTFRPHCIHELDDPSYIRALASFDQGGDEDAPYNDDLYAPPTPTPQRVRVTGWIDTVDAATELSAFAASRARAGAPSGPPPPSSAYTRTGDRPSPIARAHTVVSPRPRPGSVSTARTPRHVSPPLSPSPSPPPASTSTRPRPPPRPPSPPSPVPDPSFDISFSTFNNTSTPAKPRPRRHQLHTSASVHASGGTVVSARATGRAPSYTPSPPSFSGPGATTTPGPSTRAGRAPPASATTTTTPAMTDRKRDSTSPPLGSTAMTNTLLTERARLLTELAALKRARALSSAGGTGAGAGSGLGTGAGTGTRGSSSGVAARRVRIGV